MSLNSKCKESSNPASHKVSVRVCKRGNFFNMQWKEVQQIVCEPPVMHIRYGDIGHFYALVLGSNVCEIFYIL